ncbi:TAXI family TRAP transporter solute-binding subunit [Aquibacillus sp. 3ASR75-11]|uniref:TAXI family TRAP transporter solute-binding subunit n=1 Tax=Terrihalobacillus insolitus TaxID=2950438 RepID=A0A9X3WU10_9BACI|nr:TAXI family TRAP transporter solute-binding subunit [Terrihalobacillus insolitus]MDC3424221.1 TAXI family TRAP transporter solute-binding subunit [Terrihalobacillus insolitus]
MKKCRGIVVVLITMVGMFLLSACSSSEANGGSDGGGDSIVIGTGGSSGTYYAVGAGMAKLLNDKSDVNAVSQGTKGAIENVRLVHSKSVDIGMGNWDALYFGYNGTGPFDGKKQDVKALMTLYLSGGQMAVKADSGIESYEDLKGKKVNLGPPGSTITEMSKIILKTYGIDPEKDIEPYYLSFNEGGTKLQDNDLDATFYVSGIPTAGLIDLTSTSDIRLLSLDGEIADKIVEEYPYYDKLTIPAGTYNGIDYDVSTLQLWTSLMVHADMPEEKAYNIVKTLMENVEQFQQVHNVGKDISLETAAKAPIPFHPGAEKYYKEQGVLSE